MRDLLVALVVFSLLPFCFVRPWIGVLAWSCLAYLNPQRLTYGFAYNFPFSLLVAMATLGGLLFTKDLRWPPANKTTAVWIMLVIWFNVTTLFALEPEPAASEWSRTMKIQLFSFLTIMLITDKRRLHLLLWVIVLSLAFFGVKGGFFAAITGGNYLVWGPELSFFYDNNAVALVLIMMLPLAYYLTQYVQRRWLRLAMYAGMALSGLAVLSTRSRGALVAATVMLLMLFYKSEKKLALGLVLLALVPAGISFMPQQWFERMHTIETYDEDASALGRINAWWFAFNLAVDRPLVGGGFQTFAPELFAKYAPNPEDLHDAHSIYFEMLGEQGFVGLGLFLLLALLVYRTGARTEKNTVGRPDLQWASRLARALQVSMVGYGTGGAFLGLAYFDLYYHLLAMMVIVNLIVEEEVRNPVSVGHAPLRPISGTGAATHSEGAGKRALPRL